MKEYLTVDVIETRLTSIDAAPSADSAALTPPIVKGQLKLVLARLTAATRRSPAGGPRPDFAANDAVVSSRPDGRRRASATVRSGDGARHKVRLRPIAAAAANQPLNSAGGAASSAAEEVALYQKQLRRQRHREWLRTHASALVATPTDAFAAAFGAGGMTRSAGVPRTGGYGGGAQSLSRSMELGLDRESTLAKARLQLAMRSLRAAEQVKARNRALLVIAILV